MSLLEFYGQECPHCERMALLVEKLRADGFEIQQLETWHHPENAEKQKEYDKGLCGGVPFFYNTGTGSFICGAAEYKALKAWAMGEQTPQIP